MWCQGAPIRGSCGSGRALLVHFGNAGFGNLGIVISGLPARYPNECTTVAAAEDQAWLAWNGDEEEAMFDEPLCQQLLGQVWDARNAGWVLYEDINGERRFLAFLSRSLTAAQCNYPATKRELLAILFTVRKLRSFLLGRPLMLH